MPTEYRDVLITCDDLQARLDDPRLCIIDTRKGDGFAASRIPGAVALGVNPMLHEPGKVIDADVFATLMSGLGVGPDSEVVTYDDGNNLFGGRLWWVLRHYGHAQVRMLDGGWDGWLASGNRLETGAPREPTPSRFVPVVDPDTIASTDRVLASIGDAERQLLDVRAASEWQRQEATEMANAGHIDSARHLVWSAAIDPDSHRFRPAAELRAMFLDLGLAPDREVIVYCQGGIRSAHSVLALKLAGFDQVRNYEAAWGEWSRRKLPAVIEPLP